LGTVVMTATGDAEGGPVLLTAPTISTFFAATATSGEVLGVVPGVYQYDDGVRFTGTVGVGDLVSRPAVDKAVFYIGSNPSVSSITDAYKNWYLFCDGCLSYESVIGLPPAFSGVYSYDGATKRITVNWTGNSTPTIGGTWRLVKDYPVSRKGQWKRNGSSILGANTRAYAITPADIGQSITYEETAGFVDSTFIQNPNSLVLPPVPTTSTTVSSAAYISSSSFSGTGRITSAADFNYEGSFLAPYGFSDTKISVVPASQSQNGQTSLLLSDFLANNATGFNEISIPVLSTSSNPTSLNTAVINRSVSDVFDGWGSEAKSGIQPIVSGAYALPGSSNMVIGNTGYYTYQKSSYFVKRPANITTATSLNPFFVYPANQGNQRWAGGSICDIPSALQGTLGGDLLASSGILAVASNNSQAPAGMVFNSSDIDAAAAKYETGTVVSGNTTTAILAASASSTPNYYVNWQVVFQIGGSSSGNVGNVTAYNNSTKQITFESFGISVTAGSTYRLIAPVTAKQLYGKETPFESGATYPVLWDTVNSWNYCAFIPKGTTSVVNVTNALIGRKQYGLWTTFGDAYGNYWGGINGGPERVITEGVPSAFSPGPVDGSIWRNDSNNFCLFWVYDSSDLAQVVSGAKTYSQITPSAVFSFMLPYAVSNGSISAAFDNTTNRLYIYRPMSTIYGAKYVISVYSCNKYV
jgi:hypothetical protein